MSHDIAWFVLFGTSKRREGKKTNKQKKNKNKKWILCALSNLDKVELLPRYLS
jgi:hypothetical protein